MQPLLYNVNFNLNDTSYQPNIYTRTEKRFSLFFNLLSHQFSVSGIPHPYFHEIELKALIVFKAMPKNSDSLQPIKYSAIPLKCGSRNILKVCTPINQTDEIKRIFMSYFLRLTLFAQQTFDCALQGIDTEENKSSHDFIRQWLEHSFNRFTNATDPEMYITTEVVPFRLRFSSIPSHSGYTPLLYSTILDSDAWSTEPTLLQRAITSEEQLHSMRLISRL